MTSLKE